MPLPLLAALPWLAKLSAIKPLFKKYWKEMIVIGMAGMLVYQNFSETRFLLWIETIPSLEKRLETREAAFLACKDGNDKLSEAIDKRNTQIEEWRKLTEKHERDIAILQADLAAARANTNKEVDDILNDPTPQSCEEAIKYLRDGTEDVKW